MITISLVDDHALVRYAFKQMIQSNNEFTVIAEACNGKEFIEQLKKDIIPDMALIDIYMPEMGGLETTCYITKNYPNIKVLNISAAKDEFMIKKLYYAGSKGFIKKHDEPEIFWQALYAVMNNNIFFKDLTEQCNTHSLIMHPKKSYSPEFSSKEMEFLKLCVSDFTYKEIADKMKVKTRTIDNYRDSIYEKLNMKTRASLVLYAIETGIVSMDYVHNMP